MRHWWKDDRLKLPSGGRVTLSGNPKDIIWLPDLYIRNSLQIVKHIGFTETIRTAIKGDGEIYSSLR